MANATTPTPRDANVYYVPHGSRWPIIGSVALFTPHVRRVASWLNEAPAWAPAACSSSAW